MFKLLKELNHNLEKIKDVLGNPRNMLINKPLTVDITQPVTIGPQEEPLKVNVIGEKENIELRNWILLVLVTFAFLVVFIILFFSQPKVEILTGLPQNIRGSVSFPGMLFEGDEEKIVLTVTNESDTKFERLKLFLVLPDKTFISPKSNNGSSVANIEILNPNESKSYTINFKTFSSAFEFFISKDSIQKKSGSKFKITVWPYALKFFITILQLALIVLVVPTFKDEIIRLKRSFLYKKSTNK